MKGHYFLISLCILAIVLAPLALPTTTHAQQVEVIKVREMTADATFSWTDAIGCIQTDIFILLSIHREKTTPDGQTIFVPSAFVGGSVFDICNNVAIRLPDGSTEQFTYDFGGNLDSASLQAVVPVFDQANQTTYDIAVDMNWTGQGDIITTHEHSKEWLSPGLGIITNFNGSIRDAMAVGTVNIVGQTENFALPGSQIDGNIQKLQVGNITILRQ